MLINTLEIIIPIGGETYKSPPYFNNFIYSLPIETLNLFKLENCLIDIKNQDIQFTNLILSSTYEISNLNFEVFEKLINTIKPFYNLFKYKYIRTNSNILKRLNDDKFKLINNDFSIRIQRYCLDDQLDYNFFDYKYSDLQPYVSYNQTLNFYNSNKSYEIICLNDTTYDSLKILLDELILKYQANEFILYIPKIYGTYINSNNIREIEYSKWILDNAYKQNIDKTIIEYVNSLTLNCGLQFKEYYDWQYQNKKITMNYSNNLQLRNNNNYIFYGNKLIDYDGNITV